MKFLSNLEYFCNAMEKAIDLTTNYQSISHALIYPNWPIPPAQIWFNNSHYCALQWRHYDHDCVSNHQPRGCLLNRLFRRRSKKTSKLRVTGLCVGNSPGPVNSPHIGPVTRKMFPFDDVIMDILQFITAHADPGWFKDVFADDFPIVNQIRW